jgi:hypothetical protein
MNEASFITVYPKLLSGFGLIAKGRDSSLTSSPQWSITHTGKFSTKA